MPSARRPTLCFDPGLPGDSQTNMAIGGHPAFAASINGASGSSIGNIGPFNEQGLFWVANRFERGHRIRVDVSSSSFPHPAARSLKGISRGKGSPCQGS